LNKVNCPTGYNCLVRQNPDGGHSSYDNLLWAMLGTFELFTLDGWSEQMYRIRVATGSYSFDFYFIMCGMVGAFFVVELVTCVQFFYYESHKEITQKNSKVKAQK